MKNYPRRDAVAARIRYDDRRVVINKIKMDRGCAVCGYNEHPAALHFDHIDPFSKSFGIATSHTRKLEVVLAEIEKCQVLCSNHHSVKTYEDELILHRHGRPRKNIYDEHGILMTPWGQ